MYSFLLVTAGETMPLALTDLLALILHSSSAKPAVASEMISKFEKLKFRNLSVSGSCCSATERIAINWLPETLKMVFCTDTVLLSFFHGPVYSLCRHSCSIFRQYHKSWFRCKNNTIFLWSEFHMLVWLAWGLAYLHCSLNRRGNTAAVIMASHADARAHAIPSVAQYSLKKLFFHHRGPPYTCLCIHNPKILQEV